MTHKKDIFQAIYSQPKTIKEIQQELSHLSEAIIRVTLNQLVLDGVVSIIGKKENHKVYARDDIRVQSYQNSPDFHPKYSDLMHDTEACRLAYQFFSNDIPKFLDAIKMETIRVEMVNCFGDDEPPQHVIPIVEGLLEVSSNPIITIDIFDPPNNQVSDYYSTKLRNIFYVKEHNGYTDHYLSKKIPTVSPKTGKIITGPIIYCGKIRNNDTFYTQDEILQIKNRDKKLKEFREKSTEEEKEKRREERKANKLKDNIPFKFSKAMDDDLFYSDPFVKWNLEKKSSDPILRYRPPSLQKKIINENNISWYRSNIKGIFCCGLRITPIFDPEDNYLRSNQFELLKEEVVLSEESHDIKYQFFTIQDHKHNQFYCFLEDEFTKWKWEGFRCEGEQINRIVDGETPRDVLNLWQSSYKSNLNHIFQFDPRQEDELPYMFIKMKEEEKKMNEEILAKINKKKNNKQKISLKFG